jgi:predicted RNA-binding protein YlqC (UPF0109 family)
VKELVGALIQGLGVQEQDCAMTESVQDLDVTLEVSLPLPALHLLDGREHRTARAVRQVLSAAAAAQNKRFHLVARAKG